MWIPYLQIENFPSIRGFDHGLGNGVFEVTFTIFYIANGSFVLFIIRVLYIQNIDLIAIFSQHSP